MFLYLKHLHAADSSFGTIIKSFSKNIEETFCEGWKWMSKLFDIGEKKKFFQKPLIFSKSSKHFIIELAQGNSN